MLTTDAEVDRFMAGHFAGRASGVRLLAAGEWSRAYACLLDGREAVIRFGDHVEDFHKDKVMAARGSVRLPIPRVHQIGFAGDGFFAVSERVHGRPLDDLDATGMRRVLPSLLAALDATREIDVTASKGYGVWAPDGTAPAANWPRALLAVSGETTRVPGWRAALAASPAGGNLFDQAYAKLRELAKSLPDGRHLIHGDLLNRNVLVKGADIAAVIDWGNSLCGDWLYDAAWLIYWWPYYPQWRDIDIAAELEEHWRRKGTLPADRHHRLRAYLLHIGLDAMAYTAYRGRWDDLSRIARQTADLI